MTSMIIVNLLVLQYNPNIFLLKVLLEILGRILVIFHFAITISEVSIQIELNEFSVFFLESLEYEFDLLTLTETRFVRGCGFGIDNYKGWHCGRELGGGGGGGYLQISSLTSHSVMTLLRCVW